MAALAPIVGGDANQDEQSAANAADDSAVDADLGSLHSLDDGAHDNPQLGTVPVAGSLGARQANLHSSR